MCARCSSRNRQPTQRYSKLFEDGREIRRRHGGVRDDAGRRIPQSDLQWRILIHRVKKMCLKCARKLHSASSLSWASDISMNLLISVKGLHRFLHDLHQSGIFSEYDSKSGLLSWYCFTARCKAPDKIRIWISLIPFANGYTILSKNSRI